MQNRNRFRKKWLRYHKGYERKAFKIFRKVFAQWGKDLDIDSISALNYESVIRNSVKRNYLLNAYKDVYIDIGIIHGERIGKELNKQPLQKFFVLDDFTTDFMRFIFEWLNNNKVASLRTISDTYQLSINRLISSMLEDGKTIQEIITEVKKLVNSPSFYRWQAARIARTETTTAANLATIRSSENYDFQVVKEWISSSDARTRRIPKDRYDHYEMNGVRAEMDETFLVPDKLGITDNIMYPGDPKGRPGTIINCRCTIAVIPKRDREGNLIPK